MVLFLFLLWLVLNGRVTLEILLLGAVLSAAIFGFLLAFTEYTLRFDRWMLRSTIYLVPYIFVLVREIIKANIAVTRVLLNRNIPLQKTLATVDIPLQTDLARMILANSITLTPGTITVTVEGSRFQVHCLSRELLDGIEQSTFVRLLQKMEQPLL